MADQPTIVNSDYSEIAMFNNTYGDRTVTVAAGDTLAKYTVLGIDSTSGKMELFASDATDGTDTPRAILMQELDNSAGGSAADFDRIQVMLTGALDSALIVFDNGTDTLDTMTGAGTRVRDALKTEGLLAIERNVLDSLDNQ
ncbi:MAG: head decoration protein [Phycisphaerales bacterium JB058]